MLVHDERTCFGAVFGGAGDRTQCLMHARPERYKWATSSFLRGLIPRALLKWCHQLMQNSEEVSTHCLKGNAQQALASQWKPATVTLPPRQRASLRVVSGPRGQPHHHCQPFLLHAQHCQRHTVGLSPSWTGILKKIQLYNIWPGHFYTKHLIFQRPVPIWRALWHPWICMINDLYSDLFLNIHFQIWQPHWDSF